MIPLNLKQVRKFQETHACQEVALAHQTANLKFPGVSLAQFGATANFSSATKLLVSDGPETASCGL